MSQRGGGGAGCLAVIFFLLFCGSWFSVSKVAVLGVGLQCVIVVFPGHTHLFFNMKCM